MGIRKHIIFIPFKNCQQEFKAKSENWKQVYKDSNKKRKYFILPYDGKESYTMKFWTQQNDNVAIYVRGHGSSGGSSIVAGTERLHYEIVCNRLIESGLTFKGFRGDIKFYN